MTERKSGKIPNQRGKQGQIMKGLKFRIYCNNNEKLWED